MKKLSITFSLLIAVLFSFGQECSYYHKKSCDNSEWEPMTYDSQSKSAILGKGQVSEFHLVAYKGLDYRISTCNEAILGDQIQFRIYEKKRILIKPKVENTEQGSEACDDNYSDENYSDDSYSEDSYSDDSYSDNSYSEDDYSDEPDAPVKNKGPQFKMVKEMLYDNKDAGFNNMLEFTAEGPMSLIIEILVPGSGGMSKLKIREMGCVGVLIEHKKSKKVGF